MTATQCKPSYEATACVNGRVFQIGSAWSKGSRASVIKKIVNEVMYLFPMDSKNTALSNSQSSCLKPQNQFLRIDMKLEIRPIATATGR